MRKKQHKQLNPQNRDFDRFYLINYLEPGKTWKSMMKELDGFEEEEPSDWTDWVEETSASLTSLVCLFCSEIRNDDDSLKDHMRDNHFFDVTDLFKNLSLYQRIKLVNFIRKLVKQSRCPSCKEEFANLTDHINETKHASSLPCELDWNQAEYFFPTLENDQLLCCLDDADNEGSGLDSPSVVPEEIKVLDWKDAPEEIRKMIALPRNRR